VDLRTGFRLNGEGCRTEEWADWPCDGGPALSRHWTALLPAGHCCLF